MIVKVVPAIIECLKMIIEVAELMKPLTQLLATLLQTIEVHATNHDKDQPQKKGNSPESQD